MTIRSLRRRWISNWLNWNPHWSVKAPSYQFSLWWDPTSVLRSGDAVLRLRLSWLKNRVHWWLRILRHQSKLCSSLRGQWVGQWVPRQHSLMCFRGCQRCLSHHCCRGWRKRLISRGMGVSRWCIRGLSRQWHWGAGDFTRREGAAQLLDLDQE